MIKCALQFCSKSTLPNHYFTIIVQQIKSSPMLVFDEKGKPEYPGKKEREENQQTHSTYDAWCGY